MRRAGLLLAALLAPSAGATDLDDLLAALRRARTLEARGEVKITVLFPPRTVPTRTARRLPLVAFTPALITRNFTVSRTDGGAVAGRTTTRFDLLPKVGSRARWSLWVDQEWNIPLAYEERTATGDVARRAEFVTVNPKPVRVTVAVPARPVALRAAVDKALPGVALPAGFEPSGVTARADGGLTVSLTDGVNVLALVSAPRNVKAAPGVASRRVGTGFVWLVGNLPQDALAAALAGITGVDPSGLGTFVMPDASKQ
ncbi:transcriptional regulator [Deinococcus sp.]|uniref:transcriptional regulator n=1 Tax=Deinococcus sp. TaxID=47478 RepID=UPI0028699915|nr:transcriptional regulator [Deinococcus sp.]